LSLFAHRRIDPRELASFLLEALNSGLWGIVLDKRLVDGGSVEESLVELRLMGLYDVRKRGDYVIVALNRKFIVNRCLYEQCGKVREEHRDICISRCFMDTLSDLRKRLERRVRRR